MLVRSLSPLVDTQQAADRDSVLFLVLGVEEAGLELLALQPRAHSLGSFEAPKVLFSNRLTPETAAHQTIVYLNALNVNGWYLMPLSISKLTQLDFLVHLPQARPTTLKFG